MAVESFKELISYQENLYNLSHLGWTYHSMGDYQNAIIQYERALTLTNLRPLQILGYLANGYFQTGQLDEAQRIVDELLGGFANEKKNAALSLAVYYSGQGDIDASFEWLEASIQKHDFSIIRLKINPIFKPLHSDPRWQVMLNKVGFPN